MFKKNSQNVLLPQLKKCIFIDKEGTLYEHVMSSLPNVAQHPCGLIYTSSPVIKIGENRVNTFPTFKAPILEIRYPDHNDFYKNLLENRVPKKSYVFFSKLDPRCIKELSHREKDKILFEIGCNTVHGIEENFKLEISRLVTEICFKLYSEGSFKIFYQDIVMSKKNFTICTRDDLFTKDCIDPYLSNLIKEELRSLDLLDPSERDLFLINKINDYKVFNDYGIEKESFSNSNDNSLT